MPSNKLPPLKTDGNSITLPDGAKVRWVSPPAVFRIQENTIKQRGEGGRISFVADNTEDDRLTEDMKIMAGTLMLNFRKDEPMEVYPEPSEDGGKRWTVLLIEHTPQQ